MKIGMWNVRSLFWSGALKVLHNELPNLDFDVVALQEARLDGGIVVFKSLITLLYSVVDKKVKKQEFGCGFYVSGEFLKCVEDFKIINERICYLRLRAKWFSCALINVHAPTSEKKNGRDKRRILQFIRGKYKSNSWAGH
jgi:exonuclease III